MCEKGKNAHLALVPMQSQIPADFESRSQGKILIPFSLPSDERLRQRLHLTYTAQLLEE